MSEFLNLYKIELVNLASGGASLNDVLQWNGTQWVPAPGGGGGSVTSVGLSMPSIFSVANSPVTTAGTIVASLVSQAANSVWAAPDGAVGAPTFRVLVAADIPTIPASGVSGLAAVATSGSASDITTGSLGLARIEQAGAVAGDQIEWNGTGWVPYTLHNPVFAYNVDSTVDVITYAGGATKTFNYNLDGSVNFIDFLRGSVTIRKTFAYNLDGSVQSITRSIF